MSKSTALKKIQDINLKIEELKREQQKVQQQVAGDLVSVINKYDGFNLDMNVLVGILIDGITKAQSDSKQEKMWEDLGLKFRKGKSPTSSRNSAQSQKAA